MRTLIKMGSAQLLLVFLLGSIMACSSSDSETPPEPDSSKNPTTNPSPNPNPSPNTSNTQDDIPQVDDEVTRFMELYQVPGAALAVSVDEKMVYSKGYGLANVENSIAVEADDLFRIASTSKVFTATAILKLVDEGLVSLDEPVFGPEGVLGDDFGTAVLTEDELDITVDHLLQVESYSMRIMERTPDAIPSCTYTSDSWTPQELEGGSEGSELELKCPSSAFSGYDENLAAEFISSTLAWYESTKGYAQVIVYLKPKS